MQLETTLVNYDAYKWQIWLGIAFAVIIGGYLLYLVIVDVFCRKAKEFEDAPTMDTEKQPTEIEKQKVDPVDEFIKANCDECEHEPVTYRVGITNYATEIGAKTRCEYLWKRHRINAEVTLIFANEGILKTDALNIWDFNK